MWGRKFHTHGTGEMSVSGLLRIHGIHSRPQPQSMHEWEEWLFFPQDHAGGGSTAHQGLPGWDTSLQCSVLSGQGTHWCHICPCVFPFPSKEVFSLSIHFHIFLHSFRKSGQGWMHFPGCLKQNSKRGECNSRPLSERQPADRPGKTH